MSTRQMLIIFAVFDLICAAVILRMVVKQRPPLIYVLYFLGILASMAAALLLRQPLLLSVGAVLYALLRKEMWRRQKARDEDAEAKRDLEE